jgi:hypothetical protein
MSTSGPASSLLTATKQILEMIAAGAGLPDILTNLCDAIDRQNPDMMSMVSLMDPDGQRLWPAAAPRVPAEFVEAISPLLIGENMSSCGQGSALAQDGLESVGTTLLLGKALCLHPPFELTALALQAPTEQIEIVG